MQLWKRYLKWACDVADPRIIESADTASCRYRYCICRYLCIQDHLSWGVCACCRLGLCLSFHMVVRINCNGTAIERERKWNKWSSFRFWCSLGNDSLLLAIKTRQVAVSGMVFLTALAGLFSVITIKNTAGTLLCILQKQFCGWGSWWRFLNQLSQLHSVWAFLTHFSSLMRWHSCYSLNVS